LQEKESLLVKNSFKLVKKSSVFSEESTIQENLGKAALQKPNKKFLGMRIRLAMYNRSVLSKKQKNTKFKTFVREKLGEEPVLFDSTLMSSSEQRMQNYMFNKGFFNASVKGVYHTAEKKTKVTYTIDAQDRYKINSIFYEAEDSSLLKLILLNKEEPAIRKGESYDVDNIKKERERIADIVINEGYFAFNREFVYYEVDSSIGNRYIDITVKVKDPDDDIHKKYYLGNIYFSVEDKSGEKNDHKHIDTTLVRQINVLLAKKELSPYVVGRSIFYTPDSLYTKRDYTRTINRLNELGVFRFINIKFQPYQVAIDEGVVDAYISSILSKKRAASFELEGNTDNQSSLGIALSNSYVNKNLAGKLIRMQFNVSSGLEFQLKRSDDQPVVNTANVRTDARLVFPRLFLPLKRYKLNTPEEFRSTTFIGVNYEFVRRVEFYSQHISNLSFGYDWRNNALIKHIFLPMSFTFANTTNITEEFQDKLNSTPSIKRSFEQQFITGLDYTFVYNNQHLGRLKNFFYFRSNHFLSGNVINGIMAIPKNENAVNELAGIPISQFYRTENDLRYYFNFKKSQAFVTRIYMGVIIPYGNSSFSPYIRQFASGGSQSMRAWRYKALGPGSYDSPEDSLVLDEVGDVRLEANLEFRFNVYKFIKAAIFTDIGNVWLIRADTARPGAEFNIKRFGRELAINGGIGVRLDFNFFVLRVDWALPIYDPIQPKGNRWFNDMFRVKDDNRRNLLAIGIGYPF